MRGGDANAGDARLTQSFRLTSEHLDRFAEASGDHNPLHLDDLFAHETPYGRRIAQGALVTTAALGVVDAGTLERTTALDVQFRQPVFPDEDAAITLEGSEDERTVVKVLQRGRTAATVTITSDPEAAPPRDVEAPPHEAEAGTPRSWTIEELAAGDVSLSVPYVARPDELRALAADVGAAGVPPAILVWLAAASYTVGMLVPGRDAVFAGARIDRHSLEEAGALNVSVTAVDDRTGLVALDVTLQRGPASARMTLNTFLRARVPSPTRAGLDRHLPPSDRLAGRNVLVVGASRGLGAALCGALAGQGANVWAGFSRSADRAEGLRAEFGEDRVRLLRFDAEDAEDTRRAVSSIRAETGSLDGVALCAAPPLYEAPLHSDASVAALRFVESSLAMTLLPLAEATTSLAPEGWLVVVSSSAVEDPPEGWLHYVTAKAALEGVAAHVARHLGCRVLVPRPPRMWTDSTNTPMGRLGVVDNEEVAAAIARWVLDGDPLAGDVQILSPERLMEPPEPKLAQEPATGEL
jgi:NAD(P)-dependent dehydrogenase (short-subunit alcohol dehydrogenase family)/acyl dehydratase